MAPAGRPFCIGLTGGIGAGKSTVANLFADFGVAVIDTDQIAHELTRANGGAMVAIRAEFGDHALDASGAMNRTYMRQLVFTDEAVRKRLESILHPLIRDAVEARLMQYSSNQYVLLVVPLLVEAGGYRGLVDRVLLVDCDEARQLQRAMARDGLTEVQAQAILSVQASRKQRLVAADDVIENTGELATLRAGVETLHRKYQKMVQEGRQSIA